MSRKRIVNVRIARHMEGTLFMLPWLLGYLIFLAFPIGFSIYMSFNNIKVTPVGLSYEYVGLKFYKEILLQSSTLYDTLIPFFQEALMMIPIIIVFSLMIAILLNQPLPGRGFFRAVFFLPVIFSTGYVLLEFLNQGEGSLGFLESFDLMGYMGDSSWAKPVQQVLERFVLILWYSGVQILIFLSGRQTISKSAYEAARMDGAGPWEVFWKITLPAMTPFIMLNLIYTVVDLFTFPWNPIVTMFNTNLSSYGYNSALIWIYFLIIVVFLIVAMLLFSRFQSRNSKIRF